MTKQETANFWLGRLAKRYLCLAYRRRIAGFKRKHREAFAPRDKVAEQKHLALWKPLLRQPSVEWYRFFANVSGLDDERYVPEDVYHAVIERALNDMDYAWVFGDKNFYQRHFDPACFPRTILRNIAGEYWDVNYRLVSPARAREILEAERSDVVVKPTIDSGGGKNVRVMSHDGAAYCSDGRTWSFDDIQKFWRHDFVIQERIVQHPGFSVFNPLSVNTVRLMTCRIPGSDRVVPLKANLRMGVGETAVDNEWAGGISVGILKGGRLNDYACSKYGHKLVRHPKSNVVFAGYTLPGYERMVESCCALAGMVPSQNLLSFDVTADPAGNPQILEINTSGQGIHFLQTFGGALLGEHTGEIMDYCRQKAPRHFKHLRLIA